MIRNIGIVGRKRSGKDTAAAALVDLGYARHGLADPLKEAALALNPIVGHVDMGQVPGHPRVIEPLTMYEVVADDGWERAKDNYPEVRRLLQRLGDEAGRRVHGEDTWIDQLWRRVLLENVNGRSVVVPDVRYPNEADSLRADGFTIIRIDRPGHCTPIPGEHDSEKVERLAVDAVITNDRDVTALRDQITRLALPLNAA